MKEKTINLSLTFQQFTKLYSFAESNRYKTAEDGSIEAVDEVFLLHSLLDAKLNKLIEHDYYTKYKTAASEEEREKARQQYLDSRGVLPDWRW